MRIKNVQTSSLEKTNVSKNATEIKLFMIIFHQENHKIKENYQTLTCHLFLFNLIILKTLHTRKPQTISSLIALLKKLFMQKNFDARI